MARAQDDKLMTVPELSRYLHLSERTVLRLAATGKVPGAIIDGQWGFERVGIDAWLEQQLTGDDDFEGVPDGMAVPLGDLLPEDAIVTDMKVRDSLGAVEALAARAYTSGWLNDKPWFIGAVVERESLSSTAMEGGVAFLHTRARDMGKIARPFIIFGRSYSGIPFGAPDGNHTHLFFLLGLKYDKLHLPILGRLARIMRNPANVSRLRSLSSAHQMRALLLKEDIAAIEGRLPAPATSKAAKPKLDRDMRLNAIRRLDSAKKKETAAKSPKKKSTAKSRAAKAGAATAATKPATKAAAKPATKAATKAAAKPATKAATKAATKPAGTAASKRAPAKKA